MFKINAVKIKKYHYINLLELYIWFCKASKCKMSICQKRSATPSKSSLRNINTYMHGPNCSCIRPSSTTSFQNNSKACSFREIFTRSKATAGRHLSFFTDLAAIFNRSNNLGKIEKNRHFSSVLQIKPNSYVDSESLNLNVTFQASLDNKNSEQHIKVFCCNEVFVQISTFLKQN